MSGTRRIFLAACAMLMVGGCVSKSMPELTSVDVDAELAKLKKPMVLLIGEFGTGGADIKDRNLLEDPSIKNKADGVELLTLDLSISSNRAMAARYHTAKTPVLVCLSSKGIVASRDEGPLDSALVGIRIDNLQKTAAELDQKFSDLKQLRAEDLKAARQPEMAMAEFLLAHQNDREAIPYLTDLAASDSIPTMNRIDAWVALARAHLWIAEPEKARHAAKELIATMGPKYPDAIAGGNYILGLQDATAKRFNLARQEFQTAIHASPGSVYAERSARELAKLPKDTQ